MSAVNSVGIPLQEWVNNNNPSDDLYAKGGFWHQIYFVRDELPSALSKNYDEYVAIKEETLVISHHWSKSVRLPVYRLTLKDGTTLVMRYNFSDWKVSVNSQREIRINFLNLFDSTPVVHHVYCEGFPKELVFGSYLQSGRQFTFEITTNHKLFTFCWLLTHM